MGITDALRKVQENIIKAARRSGRDPDGVRLVAVSKTVGIERVAEAAQAGALIFGENRVQEAKQKISDFKFQISPPVPPLAKGGIKGGIEWHLIGSLQKNKAKTAVQLFDLIQSLDSYGLARILNKCAEQTGKKQRVLVQVKLSEEESKHGADEKDVFDLLEKMHAMDHLQVEGLMTIPPYFEDPEQARPYFGRLKEIRDRAAIKGFYVPELSMGMSNDYEIAVEEGATLVRVGSAIFGERNY
jgi:pyridoxal phosphate enzyme (YggS family)